MVRPSDWYVLDLSRDPTPGDPTQVRALARQVEQTADDAQRAQRDVRSLAGDGAVTTWIGLAGDVFRGALDDFPRQLDKLASSYALCAAALASYAEHLDGAQDQADRALAQGRAARAEIDSLAAQLSSARSSASAAGGAADALSRPSAAGAEPPDPEQVRAAVRNAQAARSRVDSLASSLGGAQARLDAAKRLARDAEDLRNSAGDRAARVLHDASDAGIEPNSFWEDFKSGAATVWKVTVKVATVVAIVVAVVALFVGGPLVWGVLLAASALLLTDALMRYRNGEGSAWEVGLAALGVIPGGRLLTAVGKVTGLSRVASAASPLLTRGTAALSRMASVVRRGAGNAVRRGLSAGFDSRLGARFLPRTGHLGAVLRDYDRYAGRTRQQFLDEFHPGGSWAWPADDGFAGARTTRTLQPGEVYDRFGPPDGRYLSPDGTPFPQRAIPPSNLDPRLPHLGLHRYEVAKPFDVHDGRIAPAFGQPGGGTQQFVDGTLLGLDLPPGTRVNLQWLLDNGYLVERAVP